MDCFQRPRRLTLQLHVCVIAFISLATAQAEPAANSSPLPPDDGKLTVAATILMPDGSPAANAILQTIHAEVGSPSQARADEKGRVQLHGVFGNGALLHATSADGQHQTCLRVSAGAARTAFASPVELNLTYGTPQKISVISNDLPVAGAEVFVEGVAFRVRGVTGADGTVTLHLPAGRKPTTVVAWHPTLGVAGDRDYSEQLTLHAPLSLLPPAPLTVRFVDTKGAAVSEIEFAASVLTDDADWIITDQVQSARACSDEHGEAVLNWAPREQLTAIDVKLLTQHWKIDHIDRDSIADRQVTFHLRKKTPVEGRVVMPEGANAEGLLVTGFAFGPHESGDIPTARARSDGSFTFPVASAHGYIVGICDDQFASALYPSVILPADGERPDKLNIEAYPATPLTIRVTRGPNREPAPEAWVHLSSDAEVEFIKATGDKSTGHAGVQQWLLTDANGEANAGVGRSELEVRLSAGDWNEQRKLKVKVAEPLTIEFHRDWQGERQLAMPLVQDGKPYQPSANTVALAWSEQPSRMATAHAPKIAEDGTINVAFDADNLVLLVIDRERNLSGYARFSADEPLAELKMLPMATYHGTVQQQDGQPLASSEIHLKTQASDQAVVEARQTDDDGRFEFVGVPVQVPLRVGLESEDYYISGNRKEFAPGEAREENDLQARRSDEPDRPEPNTTPLPERLASARRNSEVTGMPILVVLPGDGSADANVLVGAVLNGDDDAINGYLPLQLNAAQVAAEATSLEQHGWPRPAVDEVVLVALDATGKSIDHARINLDGARVAAKQGAEFLKRHLPATRDARVLLAAAQEEAKRDDRRVWFIVGGPRCGPCFALARWIDEHHAVLEKDYVILKLMSGVDRHADEVIEQFRESDGGIPWHAITEPDGTRLVTSDSPLGNIGMPGSEEGLRHFRKMLQSTARRMSAAEVDSLIESLQSKE